MPIDAVEHTLATPPVESGGRPIPEHPAAMLTTIQAATVLGLSPRILEQLRVKGGGPS